VRITQDHKTYLRDRNNPGAKRHMPDRPFFTIFIIKKFCISSDSPKMKRKNEGVEDKRMQYECENE